MAHRDYTQFQHVSDIGDTLLMSEIENNLKAFLDWSFLGIGGWNDVAIDASGIDGGDFSKLRPVEDGAYLEGTVWETVKKDWVYESGVEYEVEPIAISGVEIDGIFYEPDDVTYEHHYNYPLGRVIFDSPIDVTSEVKISHSYRHIQVYIADEANWLTELQYGSAKPNDDHFIQNNGQGDWSIGSQHRIQMPSVVIEAVPRRRASGYELGNNALWIFQDVLFHVVAETRAERNNILDILSTQNDHVIKLFNTNLVNADEQYPLDYRGMLVDGLMYPNLVDDYFYMKCTFKEAVISDMYIPHPNLYGGIVRVTCEVILDQ